MTNFNLNYKYQNGMATMLMSVIMVMTISLVSIYGAQVSVVEQKISSNHYRAKQAFEAAQAGMEASIFKLTPAILNNLAAPQGGAGTPTGTENDLPIDPAQLAAFTVANGNGHYRINFKRNIPDPNRVDFTAYGYSGDNPSVNIADADQVIQQSVNLTPVIGYQPPANLISLGAINLGNNVSVTNTTGAKLAATWSGGATTISTSSVDVTPGGGTGTYSNDANLQALASSANPAPAHADIKYLTQNSQFFENFFSESKARLKARSTVVDCQSSNCNTTDLKNQLSFDGSNLLNHIIWVDAYDEGSDTVRTLNLDKNFSLGTPSNPVILIVEGKVKLSNSNAEVNGIVYTTHDFVNGTGNGNVTGSLISEGNISATGNLSFTYDNDTTMTNAMSSSGTNRYTRIAGTWKDFN